MNSSKTREQLRKKLDSIMGSEQRKQFESIAGQEVPTYQVTCTQAIIPGGSGKARGRQIQYGEFDAVFDVYDLHYQNCILPHERFEISFDQERGEYYPLGSRGLFRQVKASADGAICTNVPCDIQTESQAFSQVEGEETCRVKLYETSISVWATRPIVKDSIFWVTYQPDRDKPLDLQSGIQASNGRWVPLEAPEREFLEFTCGRPYGNYTDEKTTGVVNPGVNNITPILEELREENEFYGGNFSNMSFGEPAGEETNGKGDFGRTTDTAGTVWKLFKFDKLRSVYSTGGFNNSHSRHIQSNNVYGIQCLRKGLYIVNVQFAVFTGEVILGGDISNPSFPRVALTDGTDVTDYMDLYERKADAWTCAFYLMNTRGEYVRRINIITEAQHNESILIDKSAADAWDVVRRPFKTFNRNFHFYINADEVGGVLVNQLNVNIGTLDQDLDNFSHPTSPHVQKTNFYKGKSLMEWVDVEIEEVGEIVPTGNVQDGGDDGQPGGGPGNGEDPPGGGE